MSAGRDTYGVGGPGTGDTGKGYVEEIIDLANSGNTQGFTRADWQIIADNPGYETARARRARLNAGPGDGGGGDDGDPDPGPSGGGGGGYDPYAAYFANQESQRQRNAIAVVKGMLEQYGLGSLYNTIVGYIKDGYDPETVMILIRSTPQYKQRFPAMEALAAKGRAISEAEYINYEQAASGLERRYGLPQGMLMGNVTKLLTAEVSATELNDRVILASAAAIQSPDDVKKIFSSYYGIDQGGMTAYFLDPDVATPLLQKQYASAMIGTEAARQGVGIDVYGAQNLESLGITNEQAREGFGNVAKEMSFTAGRGDVVTQQQLIGSNLAGDEAARSAVERTRGSRLGRFQGGGQFVQGQKTGEGSALGTAAR